MVNFFLNVASRKDMGMKRGLELYIHYRNCFNQKYGTYYILKCDISKFFASINHDILKRKFLDNGEINFIATNFDEKIYIQVAYILADEAVVEREFGAFKSIQDNYPKYVLTLDKFDFSHDGIIHKNVIDWLLEK